MADALRENSRAGRIVLEMESRPDDSGIRELQREYLDFLDDSEVGGVYSEKTRELINKNKMRLIVDIADIRRRLPQRYEGILRDGSLELAAFNNAVKDYVMSINMDYAKSIEEFFVGLEGSFGRKHVTPRSLTSEYLGNIVCCEGIVTKCSLVLPKMVRSVHYCPTNQKTIERVHTDLTSLQAFPSTSVYLTKTDEGYPLETEYGLSRFKDHQIFTIQEMPEKSPAGQLPRSVDVIAENDLADLCKPGDRIQVVGVYRCLSSKKANVLSGTFRTLILANNIKILNKDASLTYSASDIQKIRKFSRSKKNLFEILAKSIAPSIKGHLQIKKAILCMLLGGVERNLPNGTRLRGDINVLMVGDPSTAKSQLLRYVLHAAPRAIATTGRGSSGVGLTAAITVDGETGERRLEAGAMVLADRGVICIDEFDKMNDIDRTCIHEVMEQGRVTIAKAGINARLNARCSVLAAANPIYGRYDDYKSPMANIAMQDSLLSRFDLLFIVLDTPDPVTDQEISDHVIKMHQYRSPKEQDGEPLPLGEGVDFLSTFDVDGTEGEEHDTQIYEKSDRLLYSSDKKGEKFVSIPFLQKYIHVAKQLKPEISNDAIEIICESYCDLRTHSSTSSTHRTIPVTARSLETLIRLATAHAKCRLSKVVEKSDAEVAVELVHYAYFHKSKSKPSKSKPRENKKNDELSQIQSDDEEPMDIETDPTGSPAQTRRSARLQGSASLASDQDGSSSKSSQRLEEFKLFLFNQFTTNNSQTLQMMSIIENASEKFTEDEVNDYILQMQNDNSVMLSNGIVFMI